MILSRQSTSVLTVRTKYCFVPSQEKKSLTADRDCYLYRISLKMKYRKSLYKKEIDFHDFHSLFLGFFD